MAGEREGKKNSVDRADYDQVCALLHADRARAKLRGILLHESEDAFAKMACEFERKMAELSIENDRYCAERDAAHAALADLLDAVAPEGTTGGPAVRRAREILGRSA
jgi:hypothetical protein